MKQNDFKEVYEGAEENVVNFKVEVEEPTLFEKVKRSRWLKRVGWGLLAVTVTTAGAVLLAGLSESEEDAVDGYLETKKDEYSEEA